MTIFLSSFKRFFFLAVILAAWNLEAQQVFKTTPTSVIGFLEYLPADYNSNTNKYPIVIFLHGLGERCTNTQDIATLQSNITNVTKHGPPKHVKNGTQFPFILISPQLKNNYGDWPTDYVIEVLNYVKTYLRIDERRIYLTGLSLGGGGTWTGAQNNPTLYAAIAPVCGSRNSTSKACLLAAENLPVWAFHGDVDTTVPLNRSVSMVNAINACSPTPNPRALMTIYPGVNHNSWDRAYTPDHTYHNPNVYEWMMSYTNTTNAGNKIPLANAGLDINTTSSYTTVKGSGTDAEGTIASYSWTQIKGGAATLEYANTSSLKVSGMAEGTYMFKLTVTDSAGNTDSDYVSVTYKKNLAPTASAGADQSIVLPTSSVTVSGTGTDSDGTISSYAWSLVSGPTTVTFANAASATTTASGFTTAGTYTLKLTVKDNKGASKSDNLFVNVGQSPTRTPEANIAPIANAGKDMRITLPTSSATVIGSGSDSDGSIASYSWRQVSGPKAATLSGTTSSTLNVSNMTVTGFYVFEVTVRDNGGLSDTDKMGITVQSAVTTTSIAREAELIDESETLKLQDETWTDKIVTVYTEEGRTVFAGKWSEDRYNEVFADGGMYLYRVQQPNARISTGKIIIKQ